MAQDLTDIIFTERGSHLLSVGKHFKERVNARYPTERDI